MGKRLSMPPACERCGKPRVSRELLCDACAPHATWRRAIQVAWNDNQVRVDGVLYEVHPYPTIDPIHPTEPTGALGFGGRLFFIRFKDGRSATTRNLWEVGRIPEEYREALPDNAKFIKQRKEVARHK